MKAAGPVAALAVALAAAAAFAAGTAAAQEGQGAPPASGVAAQAHDARVAPAVRPESGRGRAAKAAAPAPKNKPPLRRRSVRQVIATVPPPPPLAGPGYGPTLHARPAAPVGASGPGAAPVYPPPPAMLNSCQGAVCTDAAGATYNLGPGNAGVSSQGRLCSRTGPTVQCF